MAATISSYLGNNEEVAHYINVANDMGIKILPPDINNSETLFKPIKDGEILFALNGLKGVGDKAAAAILKEKERGGDYLSLFDFLSRTKKYSIGDSTVEALIKTDAFAFTKETRTSLLKALRIFSPISKDSHKRKNNGQRSIFSLIEPSLAEKISMPKLEKAKDYKENIIRWEKEYTSMYITYDPLEDYKTYLKDNRIVTPDMLIERFENHEPGYRQGNNIFLIGVVGSLNDFQTKKGDMMAKPVIESKTSSVKAIAFPKFYSDNASIALKAIGDVVLINARISDSADEGELELIINKVEYTRKDDYFIDNETANIYDDLDKSFGLFKTLEQRERKARGVTQRTIDSMDVKGKPKGVYVNATKKDINSIMQIALKYRGMSDLYVVIGEDVYRPNISVQKSDELKRELEEVLPVNSVIIT